MPHLTRLAILDDYQGVALAMGPWQSLSPGIETISFRQHLGTDQAAIAARLAPFDAILAMRERTPFPAALLAQLPKLKLLITTGARNNAIDLAACTAQGITVCGTTSVGHPAADLTWALILAALRHIPQEHAAMRAGAWQGTIGAGLEGRTLGVLGLGKLGARVARVGLAFGMRVIAWSPNLTAAAAAAEGATLVDKDTLCREADVLTLHVVLSARSRGVLGARELALMRPTAWLVNTSRGPLVDEAALLEALRARRIAGAALDVFDQEPLPAAHPFRSLPNTVLAPHLGYVTEENYRAYFTDAVANIAAYLAGNPLRRLA